MSYDDYESTYALREELRGFISKYIIGNFNGSVQMTDDAVRYITGRCIEKKLDANWARDVIIDISPFPKYFDLKVASAMKEVNDAIPDEMVNALVAIVNGPNKIQVKRPFRS